MGWEWRLFFEEDVSQLLDRWIEKDGKRGCGEERVDIYLASGPAVGLKLRGTEHLECKILMEASEDGVEKWAKHRIHSSLSQRQLHEMNCKGGGKNMSISKKVHKYLREGVCVEYTPMLVTVFETTAKGGDLLRSAKVEQGKYVSRRYWTLCVEGELKGILNFLQAREEDCQKLLRLAMSLRSSVESSGDHPHSALPSTCSSTSPSSSSSPSPSLPIFSLRSKSASYPLLVHVLSKL